MKDEALRLAEYLERGGDFPPTLADAAAELRRLVTENLLLRQRHCDDNVEYTRVLAQRDALLEALRDIVFNDPYSQSSAGVIARAAIKAVEEGK